MTASPTPAADRAVLENFDRERGLRLARLVTLVFGSLVAATMLITLVVGVLGAFASSAFLAVWGATVAGTACYVLSWLAVSRQNLRGSAAFILVGFIGVLATMQMAHGQTASLDAVTVSIFGLYGILCALAGVLVDSRFMFASAVAANLLSAVLCFVIPHASLRTTLFVLVIVGIEEWVAVLLTFGAQTLYIQTAQELGDLRIAVERARKLDDLKNQFIRSVNHELRNPIMAWFSATETLQMADAILPSATRRELVQQSVDVGKRVLKLIHNILDVPLLDDRAGEFTPAAIAVRPLITSSLAMIDPQEGGDQPREVHVSITPNLVIWGDEVRLQQILVNLFSNGLKYSLPGTPLEVVGTLAPNGQMATISVRDHGLGIPPEQQSLLFERFVRLPRDLASPISGNGLGLYLCRVLAEAMGGSIRISSSGIPGEGTTFMLELPVPPEMASV